MQIAKVFLKVAGIFLGISASVLYANESPSAVMQQVLQQRLSKLIYEYNIPGASLTYGVNNEPLQTVTVGLSNIQKQAAVNSDTLFLVGSISKSFTAVAILEQVEAGKIFLNETLGQIAKGSGGELADVLHQYPDLKQVTLRELLVHTSGVPEDVNTLAFISAFVSNPKQIWSNQKLLGIAMQHPVYFKPGEKGKWSYTNTDYLLLGMVLESVSKKPLEEVFSNLIKKAKLNHTYFAASGVIPHQIINKLSIGYLSKQSDSQLLKAFINEPVVTMPGKDEQSAYALENAYNLFGPSSSGVLSSTNDLALWYRDLFQGDLLSKNSIKQMLRGIKNAPFNDASYGLGVTIHHMPGYSYVISHDGLSPGYSVIVMYFEKYHLVLSVATNSSNSYVSTFDVYSGKIIPGIVTEILPVIVHEKKT